jgi:hypothetical protein
MTSSNKRSVLDRPESVSQTAATDLRFDLTQAVSPDAMENNADSLMDAVFADVDRMLERGVSLPIESLNETDHIEANDLGNEVSAPSVVPLESILPPKLSPRDLIPQPVDAGVELAESASSDSALEVLPNVAEPGETKRSNRLLWFAVLFSSMLMSAAILSYLFRDPLTQIWLRVLSSKGMETTTAPVAETSGQDGDFLKYVQRSLDRLANQANSDAEVATQPSPTISISPAASPTVVERVYVPVYSSPQPSSTNAPTVVVKPPSAPSNPASASRPATNAPTGNPNAAPTSAPNIAVTTHTLIGVLALGERSAALFEIGGIPQRIEIGGQIGSSGWALVSINNQEAIVRKNGEVRSIYVGQKF